MLGPGVWDSPTGNSDLSVLAPAQVLSELRAAEERSQEQQQTVATPSGLMQV